MDLPDSDWGDFSCRRAVDSSSFGYGLSQCYIVTLFLIGLSLFPEWPSIVVCKIHTIHCTDKYHCVQGTYNSAKHVSCSVIEFQLSGAGWNSLHFINVINPLFNHDYLHQLGKLFNSLRPRQNGCHFPDDIFKCIFLNEHVWISIKISLKFVPKGPINNIPALVQIMAWRRSGDKPLSEPMMT